MSETIRLSADDVTVIGLSFDSPETVGLLDGRPRIIVMPCGEMIEYTSWADVPRHDVPCPCGNPRHWLVKVNGMAHISIMPPDVPVGVPGHYLNLKAD